MLSRNLEIYFQRSKALDGQIKIAIDFYGNQKDFNRRGTIVTLLQKLRDFAAGQFLFFFYGFDPKPDDPFGGKVVLQPWDEYPPEDVLTGIIDQIGHDLALIQRIADQRLIAAAAGNRALLDALDAADKLAWLALEPAVRRKLIRKPDAVITYFEKSATSYTIPYADIALIAIPFTCMMEDNHLDYLAIPHEVGHYVYRHLLDVVKDELKRKATSFDIAERYRSWIRTVFEELCADIYGCLIAGPVLAMDFEQLSLQNSQENFRSGDDVHPNAAIRPLLYCQILTNDKVESLTHVDSWKQIGLVLAARWKGRLRQRHTDTFIVNSSRVDGHTEVTQRQPRSIAADINLVPGSAAEGRFGALGDATNLVIDALFSHVLSSAAPDTSQRPGWAGDIESGTQPEELFRKFESWYWRTLQQAERGEETWAKGKHPYPAEPEIVRPAPKLANPQTWFDSVGVRNNLRQYLERAAEIPSGEVKDPANMHPGEWGYILWAQGWTTEGPGDSHMPPLL